MLQKSIVEKLTDGLLFILITIPVILIAFSSVFCSGWNEGSSMSGSCVIPMFDPIYRGLMGMLLIAAFGGAIFLAPILLILGTFGLVAKAGRYIRGYRPQSRSELVWEIIFVVPFLVLLFFLYILTMTLWR